MAQTKTAKTSTVEEKLVALYTLQNIDSQIDKIRTIRGELPLEVEDLEDELAGLETRLNVIKDEISTLETGNADKKNLIKEAEALIKKYTDQQNNVRNNREFDSLSKEIEYQELEIQLAEKRIKEGLVNIDGHKEVLAGSQEKYDTRKQDLEHKKAELDDIIAETQKDEEKLTKQSTKAEKVVDDRLLNAYKRLRSNAVNGLAVVKIERSACGGCFNQIPPQRNLDIASHKKVIVCEHCGRILVDDGIHGTVTGETTE